MMTVFLAATALMASVLQRVTGLGFALVSVPFFVILYGPTNGVLFGMILGGASSFIIFIEMRKWIDWSIVIPLVVMAVLCVPLGAWITSLFSEPALLIVVGAAGIVALSGMRLKPVEQLLSLRVGPYVAGMMSAIMHVASGISGPPLVALGHSRRWEHVKFVASLQLVFVCLNTLSLSARGLPETPLTDIIVCVFMVFIGTFLGVYVTNKISAILARRLTIVVAFIGTAVVFIKGMSQFLEFSL